MYEVTFNRNVKFGKDLYKTGESLNVSKDDYQVLLDADVISEVEPIKEKTKPKAATKKKSGD
ncbi:hypothetical protein ACFQ38_16230 [Sporosarcina contaminans]|uniref:DUF7210 domain-containing protein n=1 Tax=Sporosarcina contaminans TaxID=633403 RepID=A0ABW3U0U1_9BACL